METERKTERQRVREREREREREGMKGRKNGEERQRVNVYR